MDTSFWTQCNPNIRIEYTVKKYFSQYLYKLVLFAPGGRVIQNKGTVEDAVRRRQQTFSQTGWFGRKLNIHNANVPFLTLIREVYQNRKNLGVLIRVEEPRVQIYAETAEQLEHIARTYFTQFEHYFEEFSGPENTDAEAVLNSGAIIKAIDNGYQYKVIFRDGRYDRATRDAIYNYLSTLGSDIVHIPNGTKNMLNKDYDWMWNTYIYSNDISINSFLLLISPTLISKCHEIVVKG